MRRSSIAPASFHLMPESSTAIVTSGRPVVIVHAVLTAAGAQPLPDQVVWASTRPPPRTPPRPPSQVVWASTRLAPRTPHSSDCWLLTGGLLSSGVAEYFQSLSPRSLGTWL